MAEFSKLRQSEFWRKKFRRAVEVRDTDKSGYISRADFELILERYRKVDTSTPEHLEKLSNSLSKFCDVLHLSDENVKMGYSEFEDNYLQVIAESGASGQYPHEQFLKSMFGNLDMNGDGFVTFDEWCAHYNSLGIDLTHARASFDAMDTKSDGKIGKDEFVNYHYEYFYTAENKLNSAILFGPL